MMRGFNNTFFYVEKDQSGSSDVIMALRIENKEEKGFDYTIKPIFELASGNIMVLENDADNDTDMDTGRMSDGSTGTKIVSNSLFFIDDSL